MPKAQGTEAPRNVIGALSRSNTEACRAKAAVHSPPHQRTSTLEEAQMPLNHARLVAARNKALVVIYQKGMTQPRGMADQDEVQKALGLTKNEMMEVIHLLDNQSLLTWETSVGSLRLSHSGQHEAERLDPNIALRPLPPPPAPAVNINYGNQVIGGQGAKIQQARDAATQTIGGNSTALQTVLASIEANMRALSLRADQHEELRAQVETLKAQLASKKPIGAVLKAAGSAALAILTSGASAAAQSLGHALAKALEAIE